MAPIHRLSHSISRPLRTLLAAAAVMAAVSSLARAQRTVGLSQLENLRTDISPDGHHAVYQTVFDEVHRADLDTGVDTLVAKGAAPRISAGGRFIAYYRVIDPFGEHVDHVFVHDMVTGAETLVSGSLRLSYGPGQLSITPDGRYVAFTALTRTGSVAVYVHDRDPDGNDIFDQDNAMIELVSVDSQGNPAGYATAPSISADGSRIAFITDSALVASDTNSSYDVYVRDRVAGTTRRVSEGPGGVEGNGDSGGVRVCLGSTCVVSIGCELSGDGGTVAFTSIANNLVAGDTNGHADVFTVDLLTGAVQLVSVSSHGELGDDDSGSGGFWIVDCCGGKFLADQGGLSVSSSGRFVAFASLAHNLVSDDHKDADVFVHDRLTGATSRESLTSAGGEGDPYDIYGSAHPRIADDGDRLIFYSEAKLDPNKPDSRATVRSRLAGALVGTAAVGQSVHFELAPANADRSDELAIVLLSCTGVAPAALPGGVTLYLTFDMCTTAGLAVLPALSATFDANGTAATPSIVLPPGVPVGLTLYATFITIDDRVRAAVDPVVIVTQ